MGGQNTRNLNPKNPNSNSGSNPRYPKLLQVIRVSDHGTRITRKKPILKKSYLKFYLVLAISAQILVASHGPRRPKPYPESSFLTVKTQNKKIFRLSHLSSLDLSLDLSIPHLSAVPLLGNDSSRAAPCPIWAWSIWIHGVVRLMAAGLQEQVDDVCWRSTGGFPSVGIGGRGR